MKNWLGKAISVVVSVLMVLSFLPAFSPIALADTGATDGYHWETDGAGATITYYDGNQTDLTIPSELGGFDVVAIGQMAFYGNPRISRVTIPDTVTSIGMYAFGECARLTSVSLPASIDTIEEGIFKMCPGLAIISLGSGSQFFTLDSDGVLYNAGKTRLIAYPGAKPKTSYAIPATVTAISEAAFYYAKALESITIPASVQTIGAEAFAGCVRVESLTIPAGVTAINSGTFYDCHALASVTLPDSVKTIGQSAFVRTTSLTSLNLPPALERIEDYAFGGSGITSVALPASVTQVADNAFSSCLALTAIDVEAGNPALSTVGGVLYKDMDTTAGPMHVLVMYPSAKAGASFDIPEGVDWIIPGAFGNCDNLTTVKIPAGIGFIDPYGPGEPDPSYFSPFSRCRNIQSITLGPGVTNFKVEDGILYSADQSILYYYPPARAAATFELPREVTSIMSDFSYCAALAAITVEEGNTHYFAENGILYNDTDPEWTVMISYPPAKTGDTFTILPMMGEAHLGLEVGAIAGNRFIKHIIYAPGNTQVGSHQFANCVNLEQVDIPEGVERIGLNVFYNCGKLKSLIIPASVTEIEPEAFQGCTSLETITFAGGSPSLTAGNKSIAGGASLTAIGNGAFDGCVSLTSIDIPNSVTQLGSGVFAGCDSLAAINVGSGNAAYSSAGGVLYSKDGTALLQYPMGKAGASFAVPAAVKTIEAGAFEGARHLTQVTIPASVTRIDPFAFSADAGEHLTIYGAAGSFAQTFAAGMGIPFIVGAPQQSFQVTFNSQGGSAVASKTVAKDGLIPKPANPTRSGYTFGGWYKQAACTTAWNFASDRVTGNITLWAKWTAQTASANLSGIKLSTGKLSPAFKSNVTSYTVNLGETAGSVTVTPAKAYGPATMTIDGKKVASKTVSVANGKSVTMTVKITYAKLSKTYKLVIKRPKSTNNSLSSLKVSAGTLTPAFKATTTSYKLTLPEGTSKVTITGTKASSLATITSAKKTYTLRNGQTVTAMVKVKSQAGAVKTYKITITRPKSTNNNLSSLKVSAGRLSPAFKANVTAYTLTLPEGTSKVTVTGVKASSLAKITSARKTYTLKNGQTVVATVAVKSQAGVTKTYKITITRAKSTKATLASLKTSSTKYPLTPSFKQGTAQYKVTLPATVSSVKLTWKLADPLAKATVDDKAMSAYNVSLASGQSKTITVVVTAQAGNTKSYIIVISRK